LSLLPVTRHRPSGLNEMPVMEVVWPSIVRIASPVVALHNFTVRSSPADARNRPSGLNATCKT
jgi:hypothetical protein